MTWKERIEVGDFEGTIAGGCIIGFFGYDASRHAQVIFECECGNTSTPRINDLLRQEKTCSNGKTYKPTGSCGHLKKEKYLAHLEWKLSEIPEAIQIQMWVTAQSKEGLRGVLKDHRVERSVALHAVRSINKHIQAMKHIDEARRLVPRFQELAPTINTRRGQRENPCYPGEFSREEFNSDGYGGSLALAVIQSQEIFERWDWIRPHLVDKEIGTIFEAAEWFIKVAERTKLGRRVRQSEKVKQIMGQQMAGRRSPRTAADSAD